MWHITPIAATNAPGRLRRVSRDRPGADWSLKTEGYREMRRRGKQTRGREHGWCKHCLRRLISANGISACPPVKSRAKSPPRGRQRPKKGFSRSSALPASLCSSQRRMNRPKRWNSTRLGPAPVICRQKQKTAQTRTRGSTNTTCKGWASRPRSERASLAA